MLKTQVKVVCGFVEPISGLIQQLSDVLQYVPMGTTLMTQQEKTSARLTVQDIIDTETIQQGAVYQSAQKVIKHSVTLMEIRVFTDAQLEALPKSMQTGHVSQYAQSPRGATSRQEFVSQIL